MRKYFLATLFWAACSVALSSTALAHASIACSTGNLDCSSCCGSASCTCSTSAGCNSGSFEAVNDYNTDPYQPEKKKRTGVKVCGHSTGTKTVTFSTPGGSANLSVSGTDCEQVHLDELGGTLPTFGSSTSVEFSVTGCRNVSIVVAVTTDAVNYTVDEVASCSGCGCPEDRIAVEDFRCNFGSWSPNGLCVPVEAVSACSSVCAPSSFHSCYSEGISDCSECPPPPFIDSCCICLTSPFNC